MMDGSTASRARQSVADSGSSATIGSGVEAAGALFSSDTVIRPKDAPVVSIPPGFDPPSGSYLHRLFPPGTEVGSTASRFDPRGIELAHFRIEERIGMGGMGAVFRAVDTRLQRHVALKLLAPSQSVDTAATKRFLNEARAAARLDHENVARVFFIGEEEGLHFIAFEFVTGSNVRDLIRKRGRMSAADTVNFALQIAYALKHTSAMGVVHRDIKPSNIIITPRGRAKLVDLGLARNNEGNSESQGELTQPGTTLGTFDYISPEQAKDPRAADIRSDIYSLGCTMYHMLTGQPPYPEGTVLQKLLDHQGKDAPDPARLRPDLPDHLVSIVRRMMNSDRNRRYQTADQLIRDLTYVAGTLGLRGVNPEGLIWVASRSVQPRHWTSHIGWIATAVLLFGLVVLLQLNPGWLSSLTGDNDPGFVASALPDSNPEGAATRSGSNQPTSPESATGSSGARKQEPLDQKTPTDNDGQRSDATADNESSLPLTGDNTGLSDGPLVPPLTEGHSIAALSPGNSEPIEFPGTGAALRTEPGEPDSANTTGPITPDLPIAVYNADKSLNRYVRSLSAACLTVEDGGVIELRASERLAETSAIRIAGKNVTIRGQKGKAPVIVFTPEDEGATVPDVRLFAIQAARVSLVNVQFEMQIPENSRADHYSLFGLLHGGVLEVRRAAVSVLHDQSLRASIVSVGSGSREMPVDPGAAGQNGPGRVSFVDSFVRGDTGFARLSFDLPCSVSVENSAIVTRGALFDVRATSQPAVDNRRIDITLNHVTTVLGRSAVRFAGFGSNEMLSQLGVHSRNCIYVSLDPDSQAPLIRTDGEIDLADSHNLLDWQGERNFYGQYEQFWVHTAMQESMSFDEWTLHWGSTAEQGASNDQVIWLSSFGSNAATVIPSMLSLNEDLAIGNPPVGGATDGTNAGCDLSRIPALELSETSEGSDEASEDQSTPESRTVPSSDSEE